MECSWQNASQWYTLINHRHYSYYYHNTVWLKHSCMHIHMYTTRTHRHTHTHTLGKKNAKFKATLQIPVDNHRRFGRFFSYFRSHDIIAQRVKSSSNDSWFIIKDFPPLADARGW